MQPARLIYDREYFALEVMQSARLICDREYFLDDAHRSLNLPNAINI